MKHIRLLSGKGMPMSGLVVFLSFWLSGLQVAGEDGVFVEGKAEIKENVLIVSSPRIKLPVSVHYCFDDATIGNLYNKEGLPVAPFRTERNWNNE